MIVPSLLLAAALSLGRAESFSILGGSGVKASGPMRVTGNVGAGTGGVTGIAPVVGEILPGGDALKDVAAAWDDMQRCSPPVHCLSSITYEFDGGADDVWIVQIEGDLNIPHDSSMKLLGGAQSRNIFWRVNGSATLGERSSFVGTLIALGSITVREGVTVSGRLIARQGAVTLTTDDVNFCCHPIELSTLPDGSLSAKYDETIAATGGTEQYTFSLFSGSPPHDLELATTGRLSGIPTEAGSSTFIVMATDFKGCTSIHTYTITICDATTFSPATLEAATVGNFYTATITANGPRRFSITGLPEDLSSDTGACENSTVISGIPEKEDTYELTVAATNCDGGCGSSRKYVLHVVCPEITLCPAVLEDGTAGVEYSTDLSVCEATRSYHFVATPPIVNSEGVLSFTPATRGQYHVSVTAIDAYGCTGTREYTINIGCPDNPLPDSLPDAAQNKPYLVILKDAYTYSFTPLPDWLVPTGAGLSAEQPVCGDFTFTVTAFDAVSGCKWDRTYTLHVTCCPEIIISPVTLSRGTLTVLYSKMISVTGGTPPYVITITGFFPPPLTVSGLMPPLTLTGTSTTTLSGIPNTVGLYTFKVTATDSQGCSGEKTYTIAIVQPTLPGAIIPTLSPWGLLALSIVLACAGFFLIRKGVA